MKRWPTCDHRHDRQELLEGVRCGKAEVGLAVHAAFSASGVRATSGHEEAKGS